MNGIQSRRAHNLEKPFPGCMGRMVNLFDLSAGIAGNQLLTEKAHHEGSQLPRSRPDVANVLDPIGYQIKHKLLGYESKKTSSNKKSSGMPMKMLIAQEMSKETESKYKPPSVVAKLMGLDAFPGKQPDSTAQRSQPKGYPWNSPTQHGMLPRYQQQENGFLDKRMQHEIHPYQEKKEYKDVYEVWQRYPKTNYINDKLPQKGKRQNENLNEKRIALVRQKFIEAKRLATDEKLRQSKEFQDALEVLNSNKDLFLKFLQEPKSLFSQHLYELQSIPPPPQTKRITVLKPSKTMENSRFAGPEKGEKQMKKQTQVVEANGWDKDKSGWSSVYTNQKVDDSQPTRIVVLKPSPGNIHSIKAVVSSPSSSPQLLHNEDYYGELLDDEAPGSREVAKEITRKMHESLSSHQRNETLVSSVFSSGYVGDGSSFNRSENEFIEEGNLSDSEVMTPTSRQSWDYVNRFGSPCSSSSFGRAFYSPESLVCREAKKRLSERWTMVSNGSGQEQRQVRRSSSTLGEMLALSDTKKCIRSGEEGCDGGVSISTSRSCDGEQNLMAPISDVSSGRNKEGNGDDSPSNLLRSRSIPVSSAAYGASLNVEVSDPEAGKSIVPLEATKTKSGKSLFMGKVSSLFFSRNKKPRKGKSSASPLAGSKDESSSTLTKIPGVSYQLSPGNMNGDISHSVTDSGPKGRLSSSKSSSPASIYVGTEQGTSTHEVLLSIAKPGMAVENQDQPSPISVLEAPFDDDTNTTSEPSGNVKSDHQGLAVHLHPSKSNLIDKSPPIESVARTLSWDDTYLATATPNSLNLFKFPSEIEEEQGQLLFVQTLLSAAGLDCVELSGAIFDRWHSPDSPLDPSLLDKCVNQKDKKAQFHEAKRRQQRSKQRLLFDCVNAALMEITGNGPNASPWARVSNAARNTPSVGAPVIVDQVWVRVKDWFSSEARCILGENEDSHSLVVESVVRKEVAGKGWEELMRLQLDGIRKEIEREMLEELVDEALVELTGRL